MSIEITTGAQQRSILVPVLFLVYNIDLPLDSTKVKLTLHTDDTNIFSDSNSLLSLLIINRIMRWYLLITCLHLFAALSHVCTANKKGYVDFEIGGITTDNNFIPPLIAPLFLE